MDQSTQKVPATSRDVALLCLLLLSGAATALVLVPTSDESFAPVRVALLGFAVACIVDIALWVLRHRFASAIFYPLLIVVLLLTAYLAFVAFIGPFGSNPNGSMFPYDIATVVVALNTATIIALGLIGRRRDFELWAQAKGDR